MQVLQKMEQNYLFGEVGHAISKMCAGQATKEQTSVCANQTIESWWMQLGVRCASRQ